VTVRKYGHATLTEHPVHDIRHWPLQVFSEHGIEL